ncbi:GntR family transcriptional regulator [Streptomyces ipomoeae]|uniref:GntR family transcriptional regulator n=1 Tax=Streptomyces ipomoeae TaxID=103232 RepID=UPI0029A5C1EA|nr:GntR family transcriptional regulator [Streptomyces ipomoeae]MDX2823085.1 GntR family transcriptional regulator [Streptomyces ipomoeae]MDX2873544.1 GntR family transcriptional regulator [Streptomyces ipomoeae]
MTGPTLSSLARSTTLREQALVALRTAITSGQYRPGDHLGEVEIAERLSVSRGTVREALRHLQQEGLVTAGARGMLRVSQLSPVEVRELFQVRETLEGLAIRQIIESSRGPEAARALREAVARLGEAVESGADLSAKVEADLAFHHLLCEQAGNSILLRTWRQLEGPIRVVIMSAATDRREAAMAASAHLPVVEAIERGDAAGALDVLHAHMASAVEQLGVADGDRAIG